MFGSCFAIINVRLGIQITILELPVAVSWAQLQVQQGAEGKELEFSLLGSFSGMDQRISC